MICTLGILKAKQNHYIPVYYILKDLVIHNIPECTRDLDCSSLTRKNKAKQLWQSPKQTGSIWFRLPQFALILLPNWATNHSPNVDFAWFCKTRGLKLRNASRGTKHVKLAPWNIIAPTCSKNLTVYLYQSLKIVEHHPTKPCKRNDM